MPRESLAARRTRTAQILARLERAYPHARISLRYRTRFQLLVAVILSAQCTDAMVNRVTRTLFRRYPTALGLARADPRELEQAIRPTGYYRAKARNLIACARALRDRHGGRVPDTLEALVALPGVGRKTANVILWNAFGKLEGIAVDTHVTRLSRLLGLTARADATGIERDLVRVVPHAAWGQLTHLLIGHGRTVCVARRPRCGACVVSDLCPSAFRGLRPPVRPAPGRVGGALRT